MESGLPLELAGLEGEGGRTVGHPRGKERGIGRRTFKRGRRSGEAECSIIMTYGLWQGRYMSATGAVHTLVLKEPGPDPLLIEDSHL